MRRYANKIDASQPKIVKALEDAEVGVWVIGRPVDLLTRFWSNTARRFVWQPIECKPEDLKNANRKDQQDQKEFIEQNNIPVVRTPEQALEAIRKLGGAV